MAHVIANGGVCMALRSPPSRPLLAALILAVYSAILCGRNVAAQDDGTAGNTCRPILQAGVYNAFQTTSPNGLSYAAVQQAACLDYTGYTFAVYSTELTKGIGTAASLGVAAKAFGWGGAATSTAATFSFTTQSQFNDAISKAAAYRATACGFSNATANDASVATLSTFINPSVFSAYHSCLKLYAAGVRVTQTFGFGSKTASVDIKFVPLLPGTKAFVTGLSIFPANGAACTLFRADGVASSDPSVRFELAPFLIYTITCQLSAAATTTSPLYTDVSISTSVGTTLRVPLFNGPVPSGSEVLNRLTAVEIRTTNVDVRVKTLEVPIAQSGVCCAFILNSANTWQLVCNNPTNIPGAQPFPAGTTVSLNNAAPGQIAQCVGKFPNPNPAPYQLPTTAVQLFSTPNGARCAGQFNTFYQGLMADGSFVVRCTP